MKKTIILLAACAVLASCGGNNKAQEKAALDSVIKIHDHVMGNDDKLMQNKMKIDTLLKQVLPGDTAAIKRQLVGLKVQLTQAEDGMENWMQKFDPELKGKSHDETMNYLETQKIQITNISAAMDSAINASSNYLKTIHQ